MRGHDLSQLILKQNSLARARQNTITTHGLGQVRLCHLAFWFAAVCYVTGFLTMHILVVEDEKKVASFIKRGLEAANYSVDVEHDGEAGLNRLLRLGNIKIALVSSAEISESEQLKVLSDSLCREDLKAAVFDNEKEAIIWIISTV
jgi:hypothetical protein